MHWNQTFASDSNWVIRMLLPKLKSWLDLKFWEYSSSIWRSKLVTVHDPAKARNSFEEFYWSVIVAAYSIRWSASNSAQHSHDPIVSNSINKISRDFSKTTNTNDKQANEKWCCDEEPPAGKMKNNSSPKLITMSSATAQPEVLSNDEETFKSNLISSHSLE